MNQNFKGWALLIIAGLSILLVGCASTRMVSQVNQECSGRSYRKVLVQGNFQSLEYRQLAEYKLCEGLTRIGNVDCLRSADVFFPGQSYSAEQVASRLKELQVDGVLILQQAGSGTSSSYIPQYMTKTTGTASITGNTIRGSKTTQTYGGYNIRKPWANYEVTLWSIPDGKAAWYATAVSGGNAFANWDNLIWSASGETIRKLAADGVFQKPKRR